MKMDSKEEKGSFSTDPEPEDATKAPEKFNQLHSQSALSGFFNIRRL